MPSCGGTMGEDMETDFLTIILDAKGAPVQPIGAMERVSLQNAARGFELCANNREWLAPSP